MAFFTGSGRFRELVKRYGKVALGVHFSVSAASITGFYVAIKNNVDVESLLEKLNMGVLTSNEQPSVVTVPNEVSTTPDGFVIEEMRDSENQSLTVNEPKKKSRIAELAASSGGAFALALLCNKALLPVRVPITIALTPPIARMLARRGITKSGV